MIGSRFRCFFAAVAAFALTACVTTNEETGRSQFITIPASQDVALGAQAMEQVKASETPVVTSGPMARRVQRIGARIAAVSSKPDLPWEFVIIDEPVLNAWALPGGKVAFYSKMVESFPDDNELAAVVGHEIAHATLRHGAEKMSRSQMQQLGVALVGVAVGASTEDAQTTQLAVGLAALASNGFVELPHSRDMELEADDIGARYMARAGYDPRAAVRVWKKMKSFKEGASQQPTFLSTHPSDDKRIERLEANMPSYMAEWRR